MAVVHYQTKTIEGVPNLLINFTFLANPKKLHIHKLTETSILGVLAKSWYLSSTFNLSGKRMPIMKFAMSFKVAYSAWSENMGLKYRTKTFMVQHVLYTGRCEL